ncbi:DNA polymerase III subunit gamma/tau, partial [Escherichia coli]|nr:DNA polymerase III subunit gamma/tau [Escherichia coli]
SPQDVQLYYQIALKGREDLTLSPNGRVGMEMIVLRMLAFRPSANNGANIVTAGSHPQLSQTPNASLTNSAPAQQAPV